MSVLVVAPEPVGEAMAGPAIRAYELARALAAECSVTLAAPAASALPAGAPGPAPRLLEAGIADFDALAAAIDAHDVVVAQRLPAGLLQHVHRSTACLVADLYNPVVVEVLEAGAGAPGRAQRIITLGAQAHLAAADFVICASERQRDLWLGGAAMRGLLDPGLYRRDPTARSLIDVVPFGVPDEPVGEARGGWREIPDGHRVLLWGGGIWRWLDALTPIRALERLRRERDDVHLVFLGTGRPMDAESAATGDTAVAEAERLGLLGTAVHVNPGWVDYRSRGALLAAADLGVSAHHDHLETRFAYRARILDYLWAGLPVVTTRGDVLGDMVERRGLGRAVAPGDVDGFAAGCRALLDDDGLRVRAAEAARAAAGELRWSRVVEPLLRFCREPRPRGAGRRRAAALAAASLAQQAWIALDVLERDGAGELRRRAGAAAGRALGGGWRR